MCRTGAKEEEVITRPKLQGMTYVSLKEEMKGAGAHVASGSSMDQVPA